MLVMQCVPRLLGPVVVHGVSGMFAVIVAMRRGVLGVLMARYTRRHADCSAPKCAADQGERDHEDE
jgi:hypothetical protein